MKTAVKQVEDKLQDKNHRHKPKWASLPLFTFLLLSMVSFCSGVSFAGYQTYYVQYQKYLSVAQAGIQHLRTAVTFLETLPQKDLDTRYATRAQQEFVNASSSFVQVDTALKSLPAISTSIPVYGIRLSAALHLLPPAIKLSQAGVIACAILQVLISRLHNSLNTNAQGITMEDFTAIAKEFHQFRVILKEAIQQVSQLQATDLQFDARLEKMVATFHKNLPALQVWLNETEKLLPVFPVLLGIGRPTNYLIELLDSTELRPGGGFIGNYGFITLSGGRLTAAHITDVYLFDTPFEASGQYMPYPSTYKWFDLAPKTWSLRDSNLDADFPTAARYSEQNYMLEGGTIPVQGVIAVTPTLIQHALAITGPITVPEYHETVTIQNLIDRIHYYQLGPGRAGNDSPSPDGHSSVRKRFTELLAEHFLARFRQLSSSALPKFVQLMINSLHSKDLQIYLNSNTAEHVLHDYSLDAAIQSPEGDSLFVVDANISPSKANSYITNTLNDRIAIDANGNALHYTTISYAWTVNGPVYGSSIYRDYVRVYVPTGSRLLEQDGWEPRGTSNAFGRKVWAGFFTLSYGQTRKITLVWGIPGAARNGPQSWHYHYLIQRQAGARWTLHVQIILPTCARITKEQGGLVSNVRGIAMLTQSLNEDLNVGMDYASC